MRITYASTIFSMPFISITSFGLPSVEIVNPHLTIPFAKGKLLGIESVIFVLKYFWNAFSPPGKLAQISTLVKYLSFESFSFSGFSNDDTGLLLSIVSIIMVVGDGVSFSNIRLTIVFPTIFSDIRL